MIENVSIQKRRDVLFELWLSWRFVRNNVWVGIIAPTLFALSLSLAKGMGAQAIVFSTLTTFIYAYFHIYIIDINSQIFGIEEDKINKPDRPLAAQVITLKSAKTRAAILALLFIAYGLYLGVIGWVLFWILCSLVYSYTPWSNNWLLKNILVSLGILTQLPVAAHNAGVPFREIADWLLPLMLMTSYMITTQDFRDVKGDALIGRKTFPLVYGMRKGKIIIAVAYLLSIVIAHYTLFMPGEHSGNASALSLFEIGSALILLLVSARLCKRDAGSRYDHFTYRLWEYWYTLVCISVIAVYISR
ncbi:UbiA family prenyltransferase [Serratia rubidaea]|uniref:UbiA family prenyltransferase n=1 Tax=Serratia rubidaea TaxID=61652 RepID=UPI000774B8B4|nr:UbiA family prenyltransferase [Serratia rubidaea]AML59235.1 prenyltransferase [Serratia rubidaea]WBF43979.1 UbiA family prenyltransferase [Serratia rubidaea]